MDPLLKRIVGKWFRFYRSKKTQDHIIAAARQMYSSDEAKDLLSFELKEMCFFAETRSEEDVVLNNAAKRKLRDLGIWHPDNADQIVRALLTVDPVNDGEEDGGS